MLTLDDEKFFIAGMWWRIGYGVLRIIFGLAILRMVGRPLVDVVEALMGRELLEDPSDIIYTFLTTLLHQHPLHITYFLAAYFLFWGTLDVILSYNLIKHRLWAFPVSLVFISAFIFYEIIRFTHTHSIILLWIILVDTLILWLIHNEYRKVSVANRSQL